MVYRLLGHRVDRLVIMTARTDHTYLSGELDRGAPIVFVDRPARGGRRPWWPPTAPQPGKRSSI